MKKFTILSIFIISILSCSFVNAQKVKMFGSKGVWELGGTIYYSNTTTISDGNNGGHYNIFQFQPTAGYFIHKGIELGVQPAINISNQSSNTITTMGLYFAPAYNFILKGKVYPAIVALVGYTSQTSSAANSVSLGGFSWGLQGLVKINLLGNSLLLAGFQYVQTTFNPSGAANRSGENILTLGAGWNVFF
jgi:hypothetical protein